MSNTAVIGALRGVLTLDTNDWTPSVNRARGDLAQLRGAFQDLGRMMDGVTSKMRNVGIGLTAGLTLPLAALAKTSNRTASDFEASMKRVEAALKGVTGKELGRLSDQARDLGPKVGKGATEAADGIEALGLAGVSTADILGGALKASLDLAAAGAAPVADAASLVTDTMGQFKVQASELPGVVTNVVGALDASKFGFIDFQQALAQGGGVAASAGLSFDQFATAIAATSTQFSSGSDAGTSFKTYIQSLVPISKEAGAAMKKLGIEFFDLRTGRMKPVAEQAEILRKALGGLSDKSKTDALKTMFGSDAARTAIGLMEKGRQGIVDLQNEIAGGDVGGKIGKRLEGEAAATNRISVAFESLKIAIGQAGLTAAMTKIKTAFAGILEALAHASPAVLNIGVAFGILAAAVGPLLGILGMLAKYIAVKLAASFGPLTTAISFVITPLETLMVLFGRALAARGLSAGIGILARGFLGLTGPIGLVVGAVLLFKDSIIAALSQVWAYAQATLGPPLAALMQQVQAIFAQITGGPIAAAASSIMSVIGGILDVVGTFVGAIVEMFGIALVQGIQIVVRAISGIVEIVGDIVGAISALLTGDFAGAFQSAQDAVDAALRAIIDIILVFVPDLTLPIKTAYEAVKAFLIDGFASIADGFTSIIAGAINWVATAFPNVTAAAKGVYEGVKGWLVDKFGGLMTWVGNAAKWIGDKYAAMKERLGLGSTGADNTPAAPSAPKPVAAPPAPRGTKIVDFDGPGKTKKTPKGRNTQYDGENREQLAFQAELEAARARGDKQTEQRLQDQLALSKQIEAYQRTGLSLDKAKVAANRDMAMIQAARSVAVAKEIADEQASVNIEVARLGRDEALERSLERQAELKRRIATYYEQTKNLAEATRLAEADQVKIDAARLKVQQDWMSEDSQDRAVRLAQERGDTEEQIRQLQRVIDIRERARQLVANGGMSETEAASKAATEWDEADKARITGNVRATFKDGIRAAMDGQLGDFFKNWWKDRVAKGMEEALNSLSDLIAKLFSSVKTGGGSGGGGILGTIGAALGGLLGKGGAGTIGPVDMSGWEGGPMSAVDTSLLPRFATGGSFKVGGMSGIDQNVVSMRLSKGEMVDIRKPGNDNGGGSDGGVMEVRLRDEMLDARIISGSSRVTQAGIQQNNSQQSKYAGRKLGR
jgi:TP901 family phage tail tape measure protein